MPAREPLAIIGMGCRFPGGADSPRQFWDMLLAGTDATREVPPERWSIASYYDPMPGRAGKSIAKRAGFIDGIDQFDPAFFGISAREADCIDPQQRLLLEASWEAFEDAGQTSEKLHGSLTGVFVGISTTDYAILQNPGGERDVSDIYSPTGSTFSIAANRISYCFDLTGPSLAIDTACSSALNACHVACQSLWAGECRMAVVGGVNALLSQDNFIAFSRMGMLSPDGRCKAFDASANGFARAEGVGAIVIKPLSAAQADGDKIYAVIRSTAANQDGRTNGITVPSLAAQESLVRAACQAASISPGLIGYVEAHGTGTPVGDPIEANALGQALREGRSSPCLIGSVKTNIGHLEAGAGMASLIKVALILKHRLIPPSLHFKKSNPHIDFDKLNLRVVRQLEKFPPVSGRFLAGINCFGFGGANAHVILESAPESPQKTIGKISAGEHLMLTISAQTPEALKAAAKNYRELLAKKSSDAGAICAAAAVRRSHFSNRLCVLGDSRDELVSRLKDFSAGRSVPAILIGKSSAGAPPVFVFSGQGPQWWGMGRELLKTEKVFRGKIESCDALFRKFGGWSLLEELGRTEKSSRLQETAIAQPAIFALQVALADLWQSWGVQPAAVVGHSVGEVAAAHVAGVLDLREAARVIFHRGRCMNAASDAGRMLAAGLDAKTAQELAEEFSGQAVVAAINSPQSATFSGEASALEKIAQRLEKSGIFNRFLQVKYAFHSHHMDVIRDELLQSLGKVKTLPARLKIFSTVTGSEAQGSEFHAEYWWHNVREAVRFEPAISALIGQGHHYFLELSAHPVLVVSISETLAQRSVPGKVFFSLRRKEPEKSSLLVNLAGLHVTGATVNWEKFYPNANAETVLPSYPWQRERHWRETNVMRAARLARPEHPFLVSRLRTSDPVWNSWLDLDILTYIKDHRIQDHVVFPGAAYVEAALGAGKALFRGQALELEDMEFQKVLFLPENKEPVQFQAEYGARDGWLRFSSHAADAEGEWTLHAAVKLRPTGASRPAPVDLRAIRKRLPQEFTSAQAYTAYEPYGYTFGPSFRGVDMLWRRDGEALGRVRLPKPLAGEEKQYQFHPAMLDSCFQTLLFAVPTTITSSGTLLPAHIDRFKVFAPAGREVFCHSKVVSVSMHAITCDFQIIDAAGKVLADVQGFRAQAVRGMTSSRANNPENWLYENTWQRKALACEAAKKTLAPGTWLLFSDRSGVAENIASLLRKRGGRPVMVFPGEKFQHTRADVFEFSAVSSDWPQLLAGINATNGHSLAGVVHLWTLDAAEPARLDSLSLRQAEINGCHSLVQLAQALAPEHAGLKLWMVTRNAQPVQPGEKISVAQAPVVGLGRTVINEFPKWSSRLIDLGPDDSKTSAQHLLHEILDGDVETEVAWRGKERFVSRLLRTSLDRHPPAQPVSDRPGYRLEIPASGVLDGLAVLEVPRRNPGPNDVEIEIQAASLNFRDVMKSLGIYPLNSDIDLLLGDECAGRIVRVGRHVKNFRVGDDVIANGAGCFASHLTVPTAFVVHKPSGLTAVEAATIPVAFMTAWYALHHLGKIQRGEKILIHAATGGVGLAAIQIAKLAGAEIFATAGSDEKRKYLRRLGVRHVMDSRSTVFADEIRTITRGAGVNLVLNSLAGEAIAKGLSTLAPGGRFLEIGKRDIYANTAVGLRPFRNNLSLFVIDMGQVLAEQPETVQELLQTAMKLFRTGKLRPLPHQVMPVTQAAEAFRVMAQTKHIGKIVLQMRDVPVVPKRLPPRGKIRFPANASYLITGGFGGFGLAVAEWLVEGGARHLILTGRRGAATADAKAAVAALRKSGANVLAVKADVVNEQDVARVFKLAKQKHPPLHGIFHAAVVLDDGILLQLTTKRFSQVMAPKTTGVWNLHRASMGMQLDHFVMFSSVSALYGAAGQANYAAANSFLDGLAQYRRAIGLPALSVNWGALAEVGLLARNKRAAENLTSHGIFGLPPEQALRMLGRMMQSDAAQIAFMHVDWRKVFGPAASLSPRFSEIFQATDREKSADGADVRELILSTPPDKRMALVATTVTASAAKVLRMNPSELDMGRPLKELGVDSLMAFELLNRLEIQFGISLPPGRFAAGTTVHHLAGIVLETFNGTGLSVAMVEPAEAPKPALAISVGGEATASHAGQLLTLRQSESGIPLFFIHPAGGMTNIYEEIAAQLPLGFPILAIQSRMLAGAESEWSSLELMARDYAGIIVGRQPTGPIRVAGFSVGGLFALATAGELERRGRTVSFVGLIDTPVSILDANRPPEDVLQSVIGELYEDFSGKPSLFQPHGTGDLTAAIQELAKNAVTLVDETAQLKLVLDWFAEQGMAVDESEDSGVKTFIGLFNRHANMIRKLRLEPISAPVHFWWAKDSQLNRFPLSRSVSQQVTRRRLTAKILPGRHFQLMREPWVQMLAARMGEALAESVDKLAAVR